MHEPYIGVAGFMTAEEMNEAVIATPQNNKWPLAIGILTSAKTINGVPNKYPHRYPKVENIPAQVRESRQFAKVNQRNVLHVLHYSTDTLDHFDHQIRSVAHWVVTAGFDAVQVNAPPHFLTNPTFISMLNWLAEVPGASRIIAQLRPSRGTEPWVDLIGAALYAAEYSFGITDLILDSSGGSGIGLHIPTTSDLITAIRGGCASRNRFGIHVAGGLTAKNLTQLETLFRVHGLLGFDVESGVRDTDDKMRIGSLYEYFHEAFTLARG